MNRKTMNEVYKAYDFLLSRGIKPYYLALYGSQNYGVDTEKSDYDFKCIILPSLDDLIKKKAPVSYILEYNGGQIEVKDIRNYVESAVKVNINFLEILCTEYYLGRPELREYFLPLIKEMGMQYLRAIQGMMMQKIHALRHEYPSKEGVLKEFGYDPKQLCHIVRLHMLMDRYVHNNFSLKHEGEEKEWLINLKKGVIPNGEVDEIVDKTLSLSSIIIDNYDKEDIYKSKYKMIELSQNIIKENIINKLAYNYNT